MAQLLPDALLIQLLQKFSVRSFCRFRSTCKSVFAFVEKHKEFITKKCAIIDTEVKLRIYPNWLDILIGSDPFSRNFDQLSQKFLAMSPSYLEIFFDGHIPEERVCHIANLLEEWKPVCKEMFLFNGEQNISPGIRKALLKIISACSFKTFNSLIVSEIPVEEHFSVKSIQKARNITIVLVDDLPPHIFTNYIKNMESAAFRLRSTGFEIQGIMKMLISENYLSPPEEHLPRIFVGWGKVRKPSLFLPKSVLIWKAQPTSSSNRQEIYALPLSQKILIIEIDYGFSCNFYFANESEKSVKDILEDVTKEEIDDEVLSSIFQSIVLFDE